MWDRKNRIFSQSFPIIDHSLNFSLKKASQKIRHFLHIEILLAGRLPKFEIGSKNLGLVPSYRILFRKNISGMNADGMLSMYRQNFLGNAEEYDGYIQKAKASTCKEKFTLAKAYRKFKWAFLELKMFIKRVVSVRTIGNKIKTFSSTKPISNLSHIFKD